jgi:hypothetical protein
MGDNAFMKTEGEFATLHNDIDICLCHNMLHNRAASLARNLLFGSVKVSTLGIPRPSPLLKSNIHKFSSHKPQCFGLTMSPC